MNPFIEQMRLDLYMVKCRMAYLEKLLIGKGTFSKQEVDSQFQQFMQAEIGAPDAQGRMIGKIKVTIYGGN